MLNLFAINLIFSVLSGGNSPNKKDPRLTFNTYARTFDEAEQKAISFLPNFGNFVLDTCLDKMCRKQEICIDNHRHKNGQDALITAILDNKKIPRGDEQNSLKDDNNVTYKSGSVKGWPKSGTDSAKTPEISPELQQIISVWPSLPEHIKAAIKAMIETFKTSSK